MTDIDDANMMEWNEEVKIFIFYYIFPCRYGVKYMSIINTKR